MRKIGQVFSVLRDLNNKQVITNENQRKRPEKIEQLTGGISHM